jgi:UDP-N-acetylmuramoyl-tripeptide--D-alanyl-D-alanine ligase
LGAANDWRAEDIRPGPAGTVFRAVAPERDYTGEYRLNLMGRHQVGNALLAMAVAEEMGVNPVEVREGLAKCVPPKMRMQLWESNGVRVLDDAYNANADSMIAALETLRDLPCTGRRVAVLGDMAELGAHSAAAHSEIGRTTAEFGVNRLVAVGQWAHTTAEAARAAGLHDVREFPDVETAVQMVGQLTDPGDLVLLKASRATGLERLGDALRARG